MPEFVFPKLTHRVTVIGRTGSGKTAFGAWLLSEAQFNKQPYVIIDYKHDALLNSVERITEIGFNEIPKKPGLYILHPKPILEDEEVNNWLMKVWDRENVGLFFDELYMVPKDAALEGILTQGRSKRIPVIGLTQRPAWVSRFVLSEADFFAIFHLQDRDDRLKIKRITGQIIPERLPDYHSTWYDVGRHVRFTMLPAPAPDLVQQRLWERLAPKRLIW